MSRGRVVLLAWVLFAVVGCSAEDAGGDDAAVDVTDAVTGDTGSLDSDLVADGDTGSGVDVGGEVVGVEPEFVVGTNRDDVAATPAAFVPVLEGDALAIQCGAQGSWMVVLAFKTRGIFAGPVTVYGAVTIEGGESVDVTYAGQETLPGGDGYDYFYNLFLALTRVDPPEPGTAGTVQLTVTDEASGASAEATVPVTFVEEDPPSTLCQRM